jgi:hypothetical protein
MPAAAKPVAVEEWEALTNLSVGRTGSDSEKAADIVHKGETVHLTKEQSDRFLDPKRHKVAVIRPASEQNDAAPRIQARDLFGNRPQAGQFLDTRPDPPNASRVIVNPDAEDASKDPSDPLNQPEANDPVVDLSVDPDAHKDR